MRHNFRISSIIGCLALMALAVGIASAQPPGPRAEVGAQSETSAQAALGTAFTYQGHLIDGGSPANGPYDFEFRLYAAPVGGAPVSAISAVKDDVPVTNGLFAVELDFGGGVFTGEARFLEISVRLGSGTGAYTILSPRQALTAAPYALGLRPGAKISGASTGAGISILRADNMATTGAADGIWGTTASPSGYGGYFSNPAAVSGSALYVDGDAKQSLSGDGLVKAGAFVNCGGAGSSVLRSFNNVSGATITVTSGATGRCTVDFGFDVSNRYVTTVGRFDSATGTISPRLVSFAYAAQAGQIEFYITSPDGTATNGAFMVAVY